MGKKTPVTYHRKKETKEDKSKSIVQKAAVFFILKPPFVIL